MITELTDDETLNEVEKLEFLNHISMLKKQGFEGESAMDNLPNNKGKSRQ